MSENPPDPPRSAAPPLSREERLAAKLRENLRRRKAQARGLAQGGGAEGELAAARGALPKSSGKS